MRDRIPAVRVNLTLYLTPTVTVIETADSAFAVSDLNGFIGWLEGQRPVSANEVVESNGRAQLMTSSGRKHRRGIPTAVRDAEGNVYATMADAAKAAGVSLSYISHCVSEGVRGWERAPDHDSPGPIQRFRQEVIAPDGTVYSSIRAAARLANVSPVVISEWLADPESGWTMGERSRHWRTYTRLRAPDGREFDSITAAAKAEGVTTAAFRYRIQRGGWQRIEPS